MRRRIEHRLRRVCQCGTFDCFRRFRFVPRTRGASRARDERSNRQQIENDRGKIFILVAVRDGESDRPPRKAASLSIFLMVRHRANRSLVDRSDSPFAPALANRRACRSGPPAATKTFHQRETKARSLVFARKRDMREFVYSYAMNHRAAQSIREQPRAERAR